jgi:hypothetical protein
MATTPHRRGGLGRAIVLGGLAAGALDLLGAFALYARSAAGAVRVMQSIAGGVLGPATYQGGATSAALGVVLHVLIATTWAALFALTAARARALRAHPLIAGAFYGVLVYAAMNTIVVPLSALHAPAWPLRLDAPLIAVHIVAVGLPIAWATRRAIGPA